MMEIPPLVESLKSGVERIKSKNVHIFTRTLSLERSFEMAVYASITKMKFNRAAAIQ